MRPAHALSQCVALVCIAVACGANPASPTGPEYSAERAGLTMTFAAQDDSFIPAAEAYHRMWSDEGAAIVGAWRRVSGLSFSQREITAVVYKRPARVVRL